MEPRNYLAGAGGNPPSAPGTPSNGYPQAGMPGVSDPTTPGPHWFYKVGEALRNIITGAGLTPSDADLAQLEEALRRHAGAHVSLISSNTTLGPQHAGLVLVDATSGNVTITLPAASDLAALAYEFRRTDTSANTVTIQRAGSDTIEGATTVRLVQRLRLRADGVSAWRAGDRGVRQLQPLAASVATSALTITYNPNGELLDVDFRSATLGSGAVDRVSVNASVSLTISSGSTLGTVNAVASRLAVLLINNAGTPELAVVNLAGGNNLDETTLISTTAEGGAGGADSASTIYSVTARSNVPFKVVGFVESTQATAGTWATAPSTVQGAGGNAMVAMQSFGFGQTHISVGKAKGTTYYNTSGKPRHVHVWGTGSIAGAYPKFTVGGVNIYAFAAAYTSGALTSGDVVVPPGESYSVSDSSGTFTISGWIELG